MEAWCLHPWCLHNRNLIVVMFWLDFLPNSFENLISFLRFLLVFLKSIHLTQISSTFPHPPNEFRNRMQKGMQNVHWEKPRESRSDHSPTAWLSDLHMKSHVGIHRSDYRVYTVQKQNGSVSSTWAENQICVTLHWSCECSLTVSMNIFPQPKF